MHAAVEACCVTGANLGQPLALVMLNADAAKKAADAGGRAELEASLAGHMKAINETLDPHEQLDCLVVTAEAWTVENDLITPTFKVKRNKIEDRFAANYERWVGASRNVIWAWRRCRTQRDAAAEAVPAALVAPAGPAALAAPAAGPPAAGDAGSTTPGPSGISSASATPVMKCRVSPKQVVGRPTFSS